MKEETLKQLKQEWLDWYHQPEREDRSDLTIANYWLNMLSFREQELWDKCEEAKQNFETEDFIRAICDIQQLLTNIKT